MTRADELPGPLHELLDGRELARKEGETFLLLSVTDDGWPRLALLSVGEVLAASPGEIRFALWPGSTTTANLTKSGQALLAAVHDRVRDEGGVRNGERGA